VSDLDTKNGRPVLAQTLYRPGGLPEMQAQTRTAMEAPERTRKPVQRASLTADQRLVRRTTDQEPTTNVPRRTQEQPQSRRTTSSYQQQQQRTIDTHADVEVAPSVRRLRDEKVQPTRKLPPQPSGQGHGKALTLGIGLTVLALWLAWVATTAGASFWVTHVTDPGIYGSMHGNIVTGVFGGGDSQEHPTKLIAFNNDGHVEILKLTAGNPQKTQLIAGPDLVASGFPDPTNAEIHLQVDKQKVTVTVYGSTFILPFQRYFSQPLTFMSDGKGNLKAQTGGQ